MTAFSYGIQRASCRTRIGASKRGIKSGNPTGIKPISSCLIPGPDIDWIWLPVDVEGIQLDSVANPTALSRRKLRRHMKRRLQQRQRRSPQSSRCVEEALAPGQTRSPAHCLRARLRQSASSADLLSGPAPRNGSVRMRCLQQGRVGSRGRRTLGLAG
jgi:hypothetical protein